MHRKVTRRLTTLHAPRRAAIALALAAAALATPPAAMAYEEPPHEVIQPALAEGGLELRRYAPMLVVEAPMPGGREAGGDMAFRRLFGYITGQNRRQEKIEMTIPVVMGAASGAEAAGQRIEMTTPVLTAPAGAADGSPPTMQFVLPARFTRETVPEPTDATLTVRQLPEQWLAVRRYSGRVTEANFREAADALLAALPAAGLVATGPARMAVYNGPFTPWFMRRNEVLVPVAPPRALQ